MPKVASLVGLLVLAGLVPPALAGKTQNVVLIVSDGLRWQEVFQGGPVEWKEHGVGEKGSENVWIAVIGPDTAPLGERKNIEPVTQAQIAATVAALMGRDYVKDVPKAARPINDVLSKGR